MKNIYVLKYAFLPTFYKLYIPLQQWFNIYVEGCYKNMPSYKNGDPKKLLQSVSFRSMRILKNIEGMSYRSTQYLWYLTNKTNSISLFCKKNKTSFFTSNS